MPLIETLFPLNSPIDRENVISFITSVPTIIKQFFKPETSDFATLLDSDDVTFEINQALFDDAFAEAKQSWENSLADINSQITARETDEIDRILVRIGFTGNSLLLKSRLLNKLWSPVYIEDSERIDYSKLAIKNIVKKVLDYLNSLLKSLLGLIPGGEGMKEFKEVLEQVVGKD